MIERSLNAVSYLDVAGEYAAYGVCNLDVNVLFKLVAVILVKGKIHPRTIPEGD
jgi:hypothetical protein